jgi:uncharacterized CHY-type Zn-finger protein
MNEFIDLNKSCEHFINNVQIFAPCCNKYYNCIKCHNNNEKHILNSKDINIIKCQNCNFDNNLGNKCSNCNIIFSNYNCLKCKIWAYKKNEIYHCDDCGKCKIGDKNLFYHCHGCNLCLSKNTKHKHIYTCQNKEKNSDCPICLEKIFMNNEGAFLLRCNHFIHKNCYNEFIKHNESTKKILSCSLCKKSIKNPINFEKEYDLLYMNNPIDEYYKNWKSNIHCNDCNKKCDVKYHYNYHKCISCKSYNTSVLNVIKT